MHSKGVILYMALQRKFLKALGITEEVAEQIIEAHVETVNGLKDEIETQKNEVEKYKAEADKVPNLKAQIKTLEGEVETLKQSAVDVDAKQKEYDDLKKEYDDYKTEVATAKEKATKTEAFKSLLKDANISEKRFDAIIKLSGDTISALEFDDNGELKNKKSLVKSIADDWSDYVVTVGEQGAKPATPPANTGGQTMTKESIMAIKNRSERQKAIAENPELFGIE
jgi:DNA repair exonuclease SbcCD ATPase subunit